MSSEVRQLVIRCLANDPTAMVQLVDRFRGQVLALCYRMLGQWQDAEDVAQETFLRVSRHLSRWDASREFEPWLLTIAANCCRTVLARRGRQPVVESIDVGDPDAPRRPVIESAEMMREEIRLAVSRLRPEWAAAFLMFHEEELSYEKIADRLDRPVGTVKVWVHRARRSIVSQLQRRHVLEI